MTKRTVQHATIVVERSLRATPARVFAAWANPDERRRWDVPGDGDWMVTEHEQDFRVGGRERSRFGPAGEPAYMSDGTYLDIVPDERIITAGTMHDHGTGVTATLCTVEIYPEGSGARLMLTDQSAFYGSEGEADRKAGWGEIVDRLAAYLEHAAHAKDS